MADGRYKQDAQGNIWDMSIGKIIKKADGTKAFHPTEEQAKHLPLEKKVAAGKRSPGRPQGSGTGSAAKKEAIHKNHTVLAKEIIENNRTNPVNPNDPLQLSERGDWLLQRCIELEITPTVSALINAWGFRDTDEAKVMNGNFGNSDVKEVIRVYMKALAQIAEGALVDSVSGQVGRVAEMNNRYGWSQNPNGMIAPKQSLGELVSPEELKKAIANLPQTDLTDKPMVIDAEFEVIEDEKK